MSYILENAQEFERLEKQSKDSAYDFTKDLARVDLSRAKKILDAGCGSGIVSRYMAAQLPNAQVIGCDFSQPRLEQVQKTQNGTSNLSFERQDLTKLSYKDETFDFVICRYVMEHLSTEAQIQALSELRRVLTINGQVLIIDVDGAFFNLFPMSNFLKQSLEKINGSENLDLYVGRKLPMRMRESGFDKIEVNIETQNFYGLGMEKEQELVKERFSGAFSFLADRLGGTDLAKKFISEYLQTLQIQDTTFYYNRFVILGSKNKTTFSN